MATGGDTFDIPGQNENSGLDYKIDNDDLDDTTGFEPGDPRTSTPYPTPPTEEALQTRLNELRGLETNLNTSEIPSTVGLNEFMIEEKERAVKMLKEFIRAHFPGVSFSDLGPINLGRKYPGRFVVLGSRGGETPIIKTDNSGFMKEFLKSKQVALGPDAESLIAQKNKEIRNFRQQRREAEARAEKIEMQDLGAKEDELKTLKQKQERGQARVEQLENEGDDGDNDQTSLLARDQEIDRQRKLNDNYKREVDKLTLEIANSRKAQAQTLAQEQAKSDKLRAQLSAVEKDRDTIQAGLNATKPLDTLNERVDELKQKIAEDQRVIEDENTSPSEREAARERVAEREEELARLQTQVQEREAALPLRERIREIFKKYGWTLQAIVLAAGITISAVVLATLNGLAKATKAIGNGLKELGKKAANALPGLIGSIVSFIFKAAGSVISFLGEHAWLLILAVVAYMVERVTKRGRS